MRVLLSLLKRKGLIVAYYLIKMVVQEWFGESYLMVLLVQTG